MKKAEYSEKIKARNKRNEKIMAVVGISVMIAAVIATILITVFSIVNSASGPETATDPDGTTLEQWEIDKVALIGSWTDEEGLYRYVFDGNEVRIDVKVEGEMKTRVYRQYAIGKQERLLRLADDGGGYSELSYELEGNRLTLTAGSVSRVFIKDE